MGRIRTIKPEFFLHEGLFDLEVETGLPIRLAFAGLWCQADREGRFKWQPRTLKAQILPHDSCDFSRVLDALTTRGFVVKYASRGEHFGWVPTFKTHQVINNRESDSSLPEPNANSGSETTSTREPRVDDACPTESQSCKAEGKGKEGKGKEGVNKPPNPPSNDDGRSPNVLGQFRPEMIPIPDELPGAPFKFAWDRWIAHLRERTGHRISQDSVTSQLVELARWGPERAITAIEYSIRQNYASIQEPKDGNRNQSRDRLAGQVYDPKRKIEEIF